MEGLFDFINQYSAVLAPILTTWAIVALYVPGRDGDWRYSQGLFFCSMLVVSCLTIRTVIDHDQQWLINAASLSALIVCGSMKRPVDSTSSIVSGF
jgi:hypothetical protein